MSHKPYLIELDITKTYVTQVFAKSLDEAIATVQDNPSHSAYTGKNINGLGSLVAVREHEPDPDDFEEYQGDLITYFKELEDDD